MRLAVERGDYEIVKLLVENGADIHARDRAGETALSKAITEVRNYSITELLLKHGADPNQANAKSKCILQRAVIKRDVAAVRRLIRFGADVNCEYPVLSQACANRDGETVKLLLEAGVRVNQPGMWDNTALFVAVHEKQDAIVDDLIAAGADVNQQNVYGATPLYAAVRRNAPHIARRLVVAGADVNHCAIASERSKLRGLEALTEWPVVMFEFSLSHCETICLTNYKGKRPLHLAVRRKKNNFFMVRTLLELGADPNVQDDEGASPLFYAVQAGRKQLIEQLLRHGADINQVNPKKETPLVAAVRWGDPLKVKMLLAHGADPNISGSRFGTPTALNEAFHAFWDRNGSNSITGVIAHMIPYCTVFDVCVYRHSRPESCLLPCLEMEMKSDPRHLRLSKCLLKNGVTARFSEIFRVTRGRGLSQAPPCHKASFDDVVRMLCTVHGADVDGACYSEKFLQLMIMAGVDFSDVSTVVEESSQLTSHQPYLTMVQERLSTPLSLQDLCIKRVRKSLGVPHLLKKIESLTLPKPVKDLLKLTVAQATSTNK